MTNTLRFSLLFAALALAPFSQAQWQDRKLIGTGGESCISTDGKGNVYVVMHQPCKLYESHDFGASFYPKQEFGDGLCDMDVLAWGNGNVNVAYIKNGINGFASYYSEDSGK